MAELSFMSVDQDHESGEKDENNQSDSSNDAPENNEPVPQIEQVQRTYT